MSARVFSPRDRPLGAHFVPPRRSARPHPPPAFLILFFFALPNILFCLFVLHSRTHPLRLFGVRASCCFFSLCFWLGSFLAGPPCFFGGSSEVASAIALANFLVCLPFVFRTGSFSVFLPHPPCCSIFSRSFRYGCRRTPPLVVHALLLPGFCPFSVFPPMSTHCRGSSHA